MSLYTYLLIIPLLTERQIEEVKGVTQVLDEAEKVSELEFAKFEEKLLGGRKANEAQQQQSSTN